MLDPVPTPSTPTPTPIPTPAPRFKLPIWLSGIGILLLGIVVGVGGVVLLKTWWDRTPPSPHPPIQLDATYPGHMGRIVVIQATTPGAKVKWKVLSGPTPDNFDLREEDAKTVYFCTPVVGDYLLEAIAVVGGEAERAETHLLIDVGPSPPPPPPPPPNDPFNTALAAAWAKEKDSDKTTQVKALETVYRQATPLNDPSVQTLGQLKDALHAEVHKVIADSALPEVRRAVADYLNKNMGTGPATPVDHAAALSVFKRVADSLGGLK